MFYWTRGNESVSGLDTLQLAQYTVEDHYTSVSEAIYETGNYFLRLLPERFWNDSVTLKDCLILYL